MKYFAAAFAFSILAACGDAPESSGSSLSDARSSSVEADSGKDPLVENFPGGDLEETIEAMIEEAGKEKNREYLRVVSQEALSEDALKSTKGVYSDINVYDCSGSKGQYKYVDGDEAPQVFFCKVRVKVSYFNQEPFVAESDINTRLGDFNGIKEGDKLQMNGSWETFHEDVSRDAPKAS